MAELTAPWVVSDDEERFNGEREFATRAEAIAGAAEELSLEPGQTFWIGRKLPPSGPSIDGSDIIDQAAQYACDEAGEAAEDWLNGVSCAHADELGAALNAVFARWIKRHGYEPNYWIVESVERIPALPKPLAASAAKPGRAE